MAKSFLALITPFGALPYPDQGLPTPPSSGVKPPPPRPDNTLPGDLPRPSHPIWLPLPPGAPVDPDYGIDVDAPYPDQGLPGSQPRPDQGLPGKPPGTPDQGLPGKPPGTPDQGLPPHPAHPIVLPPGGGGWLPVYIWGPTDPRPGTGLPGDQPKPDQGLPGSQPKPDQGLPGSQPRPDQGLPPIPPPTDDEKAKVEWKVMWTPTTGWVSFAVIIPAEGAPVPTPSKRK